MYSALPFGATVAEIPATRGTFMPIACMAFEQHPLPTDPIGINTLTLTNVVVGSRVHISDQANTTTLYDAVAAGATVIISMQVYAGGSSLNNWRIKVRNASGSPTYQPYETLMTGTIGSSSIYVSQLLDE